MSLPRFLQYAFIAIVTVTVGFSLHQWNASRAALKVNTTQNFNTNGLVGHWTFDGADTVWTSSTAGTTLDDSGNSNTGTLTNMNQATSPVDGKIGQALSFRNTTNTYVSVPSNSDLNIDNTESLSVSLWFKSYGVDAANRQRLFGKGSIGYGCFQENNTQYIACRVRNQPLSQLAESTTPTFQLNEWHHLVFVINGTGTGTGTIYFDGASGIPFSLSDINPSDPAATLSIGTDGAASGLNWNGAIDDFRVYNRALSASEITALHTSSTAKINTTQDSNLTKGLTGYWKFDDGSGTTAADSSTNANTGTLVSTPTWTTGRIGGGLTFNGTNYVSTSQAPLSSTVPNGFSTFVWLQASNNPAWVYEMGDSSALVLATSPTGTYCRIRNVDSTFFDSPSSTITGDGNWHHFGCVFNKGANVLTLYVDGVSSGTVSTSGFTAFDEGGAPFYLGGRSYGSNGVGGSIDEMRIYDRTVSSDEVSQIYRLTTPSGVDTGLKGHWSFDGSDVSGATASDRSGSGSHGTLSGATITEGQVGQALSFDGVDDSVSVSNTLSAANGITLSAWVKPTGLPMVDSTIYLLGTQSTTVGFAWLAIQNDRTVFYNYASGTNYPYYNSTLKVPLNEWSHVVLVHDYSSQNVRIYINGVLDINVAGGPVVSISNKTSKIGRYAATFPFQGSLDEVRIYDRVLSSGEVQSLYDFGASDKVNSSASQKQGFGRLDSGLTEYWKFDDGSGTTAVNSSTKSTASDGTLTGSTLPTWGTGHIGGGLDFNGTAGAYVLGPSNYTGFNNNYTISVWVKSTDTSTNTKTLVTMYNGFGSVYANLSFRKIGINQGIDFTSVGGATSYYHDITDGNWHHLVATRTIGGIETVYDNGVQFGTNTATAGTLTMGFGNTTLRIGGRDTASMTGSLDEVRIYDRALSADEISQLYRLTTPTGTDTSLKGYWSFNGPDLSGTTAYDRSGSGNNGTTSGATITEGKFGQALSFDGTNDLIDVGSPASLDNLTNFSYSAWVNLLGYPENGLGRIFAKNNTGSDDTGISLEYDTGVFHGDVFRTSVGYNTTDAMADSQIVYNTVGAGNNFKGGWQHVVMTFDDTSKVVKLYLNGVEVSYQTHTSGVGTRNNDSADSFYIGNNQYGQRTFNGKIDEPRVYNRVLSAGEVSSLYNSGR
jgi:hypothetical protein